MKLVWIVHRVAINFSFLHRDVDILLSARNFRWSLCWHRNSLHCAVTWRLNMVIDRLGFVDFGFLLWVCVRMKCFLPTFPPLFIFTTYRLFFSYQLRTRLQADHVFVTVYLSFCLRLRLYQLYRRGVGNAECTVQRQASLNYSTSLPLSFRLTLLSNTIMIVPPIGKRFFLSVSLCLFFYITLKTQGVPRACVLFLEWLCILKKNRRRGMEGDYSELVQVCISNMACKQCNPPGMV